MGCSVREVLSVRLIAVVIAALYCASAHAISIDDLQTSQFAAATFPSPAVTAPPTAAPEALGGHREITVESLAGTVVLGIVGSGFLSHSQNASTRGSSHYVWDGDTTPGIQPAGLGGLDLLEDGATAFKIIVEGFDFPNNQPLQVRFRIFDASDPTGTQKVSQGTITLTTAINAPATFLLPFASFSALAGAQAVNLTNVGAVTMLIDGSQSSAHDLTLSFIGTNGRCTHVPDNNLVLDQCGVCNGDNSSCSDCLGVPNGGALPGTYCATGVPGICSDGTYVGTPPASCVCDQDNPPQTEICDALDNNCNGLTDEGFSLGTNCSAGVGACQRTGQTICAPNGTATCSATPGNPASEICDSIDNNCNGIIDDGLGKGDQCKVGVGACENTGVKICGTGGSVICSVNPKSPSAEICDGIDNDCDGAIDEGLGKGDTCSVGVGECSNSGVKICGSGGSVVCSVSPREPTAEVCDGADNNCNGSSDEGLGLGDSCSAGVGACQSTGVKTCGAGGAVTCSASPNAQSVEVCDGIDNDCDGSVDDGAPIPGSMTDVCGVCGGDGSSCADCRGMPLGTATLDICGVCGGDGTSCLQCSSEDMTETLGELDGGAKEQQDIVRKATNRLRSLSKAANQIRFISQTLDRAQKLQLRNWVLSWQLPQISTTCSQNPACVTTSNVPVLAEYRKHNAELRQLAYDVTKRIKRLRKGKLTRKDTALLLAADKQFKLNDDLSRTVPDVQFACGAAVSS